MGILRRLYTSAIRFGLHSTPAQGLRPAEMGNLGYVTDEQEIVGREHNLHKRIVLLGGLVFIASLYGLHSDSLISKHAERNKAQRSTVAAAVIEGHRGLLRGNAPTSPEQTRLVIPFVTEVLTHLRIPPLVSIFLIESAAGLLAVVSFYLLTSHFIPGLATRLLVSSGFALALTVAQFQIPQALGSASSLVFFFLILWFILGGLRARPVGNYIFLVLFLAIFGALQRYDLALLGFVISILWGLRPFNLRVTSVAALGTVIATLVFLAVVRLYDVHDLQYQTLYLHGTVRGGVLRITQLIYPGVWFIFLTLFNITAPLTMVALFRRKVPGKLTIALAMTMVYTIAVLFVGNASEFRLLLPLLAMLLLVSGSFLQSLTEPFAIRAPHYTKLNFRR